MNGRSSSITALLVASLVLVGCGSSNGPLTELPEPSAEATGPIESRLQASYSGSLIADIAGDGPSSRLSGDLRLDVDTDRGIQILAEADNFIVDVPDDGEDIGGVFDLDGTLEGRGSVDTAAGTLEFGLMGTLGNADLSWESADVALGATGSFFGESADQAGGTMTGDILFADEGVGTMSGEFLVDRDAH